MSKKSNGIMDQPELDAFNKELSVILLKYNAILNIETIPEQKRIIVQRAPKKK